MKKRLCVILAVCVLLSAFPFSFVFAGAEAVEYPFVNAGSGAFGSVEANGEVITDETKFAAGTVITVTFTAKSGYVLKKYTLTDSSGKEITLNDGKFEMPEGGATIAAEFVAADSGIDYDEKGGNMSITEQILLFFKGIFQSFLIFLIPLMGINK